MFNFQFGSHWVHNFWFLFLLGLFPKLTFWLWAKLLIYDRGQESLLRVVDFCKVHYQFSLQSSFRFFAAVFCEKDQYILVIGHVRGVKSENCILWDAPLATMSVFGAVFTICDWAFLGLYLQSRIEYFWACFYDKMRGKILEQQYLPLIAVYWLLLSFLKTKMQLKLHVCSCETFTITYFWLKFLVCTYTMTYKFP